MEDIEAYTVSVICMPPEVVAVQTRRNGRGPKVFKHATETNTAIQYGLFGCTYCEATST